MEKKIYVFLCLLFLSFNLYAQKFMKSFKQDFLAHLEAECPDSLREGVFHMEPLLAQRKFDSVKDLDMLDRFIKQKKQDVGIILRYRTEDFCAHIRCNAKDFCFDFFYVDGEGKVNSLCLLENSGVYSKTLVTQSEKKYYLDYAWGFLELKENNIPLLNCYCDVEKVAEGELDITLIPFEGTNPFVWKKQVDGVWVSAF